MFGAERMPTTSYMWWGGQRTILRSQFSPSTRSILELELRLPGLVASTLTYRVTLPNLDFFLLWVRVSLHWPDWHWSHDPPSQPPRQLGLQLQHKPGFYSLELWVYKYIYPYIYPYGYISAAYASPSSILLWKPKPTPTESVSRKAGFEKSNTLQLKFRRFVHSAFYGPICSFTPCSFRQPDRSMSYLALLKVSSALKENRIWRNVSNTAAGLFLNM